MLVQPTTETRASQKKLIAAKIFENFAEVSGICLAALVGVTIIQNRSSDRNLRPQRPTPLSLHCRHCRAATGVGFVGFSAHLLPVAKLGRY
jgi:hypothetical protein